MARLKASTVAIDAVSADERAHLFQIFHRYYDDVTEAQFERDFGEKDHVILLRSDDGVARGFSTLKRLDLDVEGRRVHGVFSGDTVIEQAYWGQGSLGVEFLKYLFRCMARRPLSPLYWFLISKGYKTYLLMANNFPAHYPRFERATPPFDQAIMDTFARALFGDAYDQDRGLVCFERSAGHLKQNVARIDDDLLATNPRVAFFESANPTWPSGTELVCLARMTWAMPFQYWWKKVVLREGASSKPRPRALPERERA